MPHQVPSGLKSPGFGFLTGWLFLIRAEVGDHMPRTIWENPDDSVRKRASPRRAASAGKQRVQLAVNKGDVGDATNKRSGNGGRLTRRQRVGHRRPIAQESMREIRPPVSTPAQVGDLLPARSRIQQRGSHRPYRLPQHTAGRLDRISFRGVFQPRGKYSHARNRAEQRLWVGRQIRLGSQASTLRRRSKNGRARRSRRQFHGAPLLCWIVFLCRGAVNSRSRDLPRMSKHVGGVYARARLRNNRGATALAVRVPSSDAEADDCVLRPRP